MTTKHKRSPLDEAPRIKSFKELVVGKNYIATGIDNSIILTYTGEVPNEGHRFKGDDWRVKGYIFAKTTKKLRSWGLVELIQQNN